MYKRSNLSKLNQFWLFSVLILVYYDILHRVLIKYLWTQFLAAELLTRSIYAFSISLSSTSYTQEW